MTYPIGTKIVFTTSVVSSEVKAGDEGTISNVWPGKIYPYTIKYKLGNNIASSIFCEEEFDVLETPVPAPTGRGFISFEDLDRSLREYLGADDQWERFAPSLLDALMRAGYTKPKKIVRAVIEIVGDPDDVAEIEESLADHVSGHNVSYHSDTKEV